LVSTEPAAAHIDDSVHGQPATSDQPFSRLLHSL
jgi:hypothetical protein